MWGFFVPCRQLELAFHLMSFEFCTSFNLHFITTDINMFHIWIRQLGIRVCSKAQVGNDCESLNITLIKRTCNAS